MMRRNAFRASHPFAAFGSPRRLGFCRILFVRSSINMASYASTRLSSKGQVVIPEELRNALGLKEGDQFLAIGQDDAVILKAITPPKIDEFEKLLSQADREARKAGIKRTDLRSGIAKVRPHVR
jgi:AbrB family looped-hinge helix DNA binding protein